MNTRPVLIMVLFGLFFAPRPWASDARALDRYDYERIKKDFNDYYCPMPEAAGATGGSAPCAADQALTLKAALALALGNNPDTQIAAARIEQSRAQLDRANAAFMPTVDVYTEYTRGDFPSGYLFKTIDQRQFVNGTDFNDPGIVENFETGISARLPLFNGGRNLLGRAMAKEDLAINTWNAQASKNQVAAQVIHAWYDSLSAREFITIAEESVATVKNQLSVMQVRFEGGSALKSDILSLKVRLAQAEEDLLKSQNRAKLALAALSTVLGICPDSPLEIDSSPFSLSNIPDTYDKGMTAALDNRPELNTVRAAVRQSRMARDLAKSAYLPTAGLMGKYYVDDPSMDYDRDRENWAVGVTVNWNLFAGLSDKAGETLAEARLREALTSDRKTLLSVSYEVKNAFIRRDEAQSRIDVARSGVRLAQESYDLVKRQYEGGSATITRYLEAELDWNAARIRSTAAYYDHQKALADIARATGLLTRPNALIPKSNKEIFDENR
ncbi:TolC family protein [Desulfatiferula olefinivorans]